MSLTNKIEKTDLARHALYEKVNAIAEELDIRLDEQRLFINEWSMQNKITNCITEIPQDIKLELNDGTLTLKAGSRLYVPNGFEEDGVTPKFDELVVDEDMISTTRSGSSTITPLIVYEPENSLLNYWVNGLNLFSGNSAPSTISYNDAVWYDTANNIIKQTSDSGVTWVEKRIPLPICLVTYTGATISSISQVFNGFGYIGSTVFTLPNVKGLIPNGRNADGSLKNIEFTLNKVSTMTYAAAGDNIVISINRTNSIMGTAGYFIESEAEPSEDYILWYKPSENIIRYKSTGSFSPVRTMLVGKFSSTATQITSFQPKTTFRAVDVNDFNNNTPTGIILPFAGSTAPSGFLICDGSAINRTTYADLFAVIGTTYGTGDGSTTFNLPNYSNARMVTSSTVGVMGNGKALGLTNGDISGGWLSGAVGSGGGRLIKVVSGQYPNVGGSYSQTEFTSGSAAGVVTNASNSGLTGTASLATSCKFIIKY